MNAEMLKLITNNCILKVTKSHPIIFMLPIAYKKYLININILGNFLLSQL